MTILSPEALGAAELTAGSPGRHLREARVAARLGVDDISSRLRLDRRTVEAIERDDYAALPGATFVRGYLRNYARLLGLPPGPIVEAFDRTGVTAPRLVADISTRSRGRQTRSTDLPMRLFTYVLVAALVALGALWWQSEKSPPDPMPLELVGPAVPDRAPAQAGPSPGPAGPSAQGPLRPPAMPAGAEPPPAGPPAPPAAARASQPAAAGGSTPLPASPAATVPAATPAAPAAERAPAPPPDAGVGRLVVRLTHDSWVEVHDREGKRLYFNLAKAGDALDLRGPPPIRVLLGYSRDAQVEYNGEPFDLKPHSNRDIARFAVGR
jgi:cytoskeleton protein RodZ